MASNLFDEDVVRRTHRGAVQFGLVLRNYEGYSSLDDSDEDTIKKGHVRVAWYPKGREEVVPENKVVLYDRSVMPGDAVRRMSSSSEDTQRGIVRSVNVSCHVQSIRTKQMIYDVPSRDLEQLLVFQPGGHCVLGSWIGVVRNVFVKVIVRLKNGSRCALSDEGASRLTDVHDNNEEDSVFSYQDGFYPGQVLRGPACAFKNAIWLSGTQPILSSRAYFKVTVEEVNVVGLDVHWQTRGLCSGISELDGKIKNEDMQPPARKVLEDTLPKVKPLNYFVAASIQIGDKAMYTLRPKDLRYMQSVPRGSAASFLKPPNPPPILENSVNSFDTTKLMINGKTDTVMHNTVECKMVDLQTQQSRRSSESKVQGNIATANQKEMKTCCVEVNICKGNAIDSQGRLDDNTGGTQHGCATVNAVVAGDSVTMCELNSVGSNIELCDTGNSMDISAKGVSMNATFYGTQENVSCYAQDISDQESKDKDVKGKSEHILKHCKAIEAVQDANEVLHDKAAVLKSDLVCNVDLSALHSDLCEASETIVKISDSFKPLLQRANTESAHEISDHVTQLLESHEHLNEKINLTEGLLKGGKKTIGVLQHLAGNQIGKSKTQRKADNAISSSEEYIGDDEDDDSSQTGSVGSIRSNASGKGSRSRPKVVSSRLLRHNRNQKPRLLNKKHPPPKALEVGEIICTEVTHTWTLVDVMWQDGSLEKRIVSAELFPAHQLDELEFFPGDFVTKNNEENLYGLVCRADHKERTCLVQWIRRPNQHNSLPENINHEEVSVYELTPHPDFTFNVGDVVVRIATSQVGMIQMPGEQTCAGQVRWVDTDGTIHVVWVDNTESSVLPQDLYKLEEDSDSDWSDYGNDDGKWEELNGTKEKPASSLKSGSESDSSWETASVFTSTTASISGEDEPDPAISEGTKSTSIAEAAKEKNDKARKEEGKSFEEKKQSKNEQVSYKVNEAVQSTQEAMQATHDVSEKEKCAADKSVDCPVLVVNNNKMHVNKKMDKVVAEETLVQLSDIEDKMKQLCSTSNSLLKKKRLMGKGDDGKEESDEEESDCKKCDANVEVENIVDVEELYSTDTESATTIIDQAIIRPCVDKSCTPDETTCDLQSQTEVQTAIACESKPCMEYVVRIDSVYSQGKINMNNATIAKEKAGGNKEVHKTGEFILMEEVPSGHAFKSATFTPENPNTFATYIMKEMQLLQTSLPQGIIVKAFSDRMDLFSVLFEGPENTPYEDGLFYFDVRLPPDYPMSPPIMHFHSFCSGRLNPNLYTDGKVCVSLLGTWTGKGNEMWTSKSNLLQVLVSIQGLILVSEPYYNEAGYDKHRNSQQGLENSRMYNETAVLKLIQSMQMMVSSPPEIFHEETVKFCRKHAYCLVHRVEYWLAISSQFPPFLLTSASRPQPSTSTISMASLSLSPSDASKAQTANVSSKPSSPPASLSSKIPMPASSLSLQTSISSCTMSVGQQSSTGVAFPLFPLSRGFLLSAKQALRAYRASLHLAEIEDI